MNSSPPILSRRSFLAHLIPGRRETATHAPLDATPDAPSDESKSTVALVAGRFCLAYQGSFCSVCHERCPEVGAITTERGLPRVNPDRCTGCRVCQDVCPAPTSAIRLVHRPAPMVPLSTAS